jgi:hypothetical protein
MSVNLHLTSDSVRSIQRNQKADRFQRWYDEVRNCLDGHTPEDQKKALAANQSFLRGLANPRHSSDGEIRAVAPAAVHVDTLMSNFSTMYANGDYIGEQLMPVATVSKRSDKYAVYPKRERLAFPDDEIGFRSSPNELEATRTTDNYSVRDYGYKNYLDLETVQNEDTPLNEMLDVVEAVSEGIAFKRDKRIMTVVMTSGSFGANTNTAGTNWNDATGGSVVEDILAARAALWRGQTPTQLIGYCPLAVWNGGIANNPKIRDLFKYTESGLAVTTQVARYFRLDDILITETREDTANSGQTASYARVVTGDVFGIVAAARNPTTRSLHFGSTFRMRNDPFSTQWSDPSIGKRGGIWHRTSVSEDHKIVSADAGFLITSLLT